MRNKFLFIMMFFVLCLTACSEDQKPHERLQGTWDIDDKASWEYQRPGEPYAPTFAELQHDVSLQFDSREQTCLALNAFGNHLLRYRVLSEEQDKITLVIGENTFLFECKTDGRLLFCPSGNGVANCLILTKESQTQAERITKAESRRGELVQNYTHTVVSRAGLALQSLLESGLGIARSDMFSIYVTEAGLEASKADEMKDFIFTMLRDSVGRSNSAYAFIYSTSATGLLLSTSTSEHLSDWQLKNINDAHKSGEPILVSTMQGGEPLFFEYYIPVFPPKWQGVEQGAVGVMVFARSGRDVFDSALNFNASAPQGALYLIQHSGQKYQIIGGAQGPQEVEIINFNERGELPFARRKSFIGEEEVCSQASPGPAANSWILFETSCISASEQ